MARGINKVILVGNLGRDPEVRYSAQGNAIANLNIATSESWKDKNTGETVEKTEWHRVVMFRRLAEIAGEFLKKGSKVYIEGKLQTRKWQDQQGSDRYTTEIVANEMQMLDNRSSQPPQNQSNQSAGQQANNNESRGSDQSGMTHGPAGDLPPGNGFDDDIPFIKVPSI